MTETQPDPSQSAAPILYYDGDCGLCARTVQWCLHHDRREVLRFAPLQGQTYASLMAQDKPTGLDTMVLSDEEGLHVRSRAALRMLRHIGGPWRLLGIVGSVVPRFIGDALYDAIARRRLAWFGRADACSLAGPQARSRFLP